MERFYKESIEDYNESIEEELIPSLIHNVKINDTEAVRSLIPIDRIDKMDFTKEEREYILNYLDYRGIIVDELDTKKYKEVELYDGYNEYLKCILKKPLTKEEQKLKFEAFGKTHDPLIREELILNNIQYAIYRANGYAEHYDLPFDEVVSYAFEGLIYAIDNYDSSKGNNFYAYAHKSISGYVYKSLEDKVPITTKHWVSSFLKNKRIVDKQMESEDITEQEYVKRINGGMIADNSVPDIINDKNGNWELFNRDTFSMNALAIKRALGEESLEDIIEAEDEYLYDDLTDEFNSNCIDNSVLKEELIKVLDNLPEKDKNIIMLRYGLIDDNPMTLGKVSKVYGISKERVRQIENKALRVLQHQENAQSLKDFYR